MPQSLCATYHHLVWSTKHRNVWIPESIEESLFAYLGHHVNKCGCQSIKIGGHENHVHLLIKQALTISSSDLVQKVKAHSSRWMKEQAEVDSAFHWQSGFAVFSVDYRKMDGLIHYIENQREHHTKQKAGFKKELRGLLKKFDVQYDERYVWD